MPDPMNLVGWGRTGNRCPDRNQILGSNKRRYRVSCLPVHARRAGASNPVVVSNFSCFSKLEKTATQVSCGL